MEFEAPDAIFLDQLACLAHPELALVRVDADERNQHVGILGGDLQHLVVAVAAESGLALGVDRKDHRGDFPRAIVGRSFRNGRRMLVRRLEILGHLRLEIIIAVVAMHAARLLGVGMNVDRDHVVEIGQLRFGHFRFPAAGFVARR